MRCWHQTATDREPSTLGTEIDDRRTLGPGGQKAPPQFRELIRPILEAAYDGSTISRPDVIARFQVRGRSWPLHGNTGLTEGREIFAVGDVIAEVVAHRTRPHTVYRVEWPPRRCTGWFSTGHGHRERHFELQIPICKAFPNLS